MHEPAFHITWREGELLYQPLTNRITNQQTGEVHSVIRQQKYPVIQKAAHYEPFCLTVFLSHLCNLNCSYCYTGENKHVPLTTFPTAALPGTAEWIAGSCAKRSMPFILGFHGGNEPLLFPALIDEVLTICKATADEKQIELLPYCTTNGVLDRETVIWARDHFHGMTLSWDGAADIHDTHRTKKSGTATSDIVQQTADMLKDHVPRFKVRATVTSRSASRLPEIVEFFHRQQIRNIEFYPVYQDLKGSLDFNLKPDPGDFVRHFLAARKLGRSLGMSIGFAASRMEHFHHTFCPIFQENLTVTPDGCFTACFLATHNENDEFARCMFGSIDTATKEPQFDRDSLGSLLSILAKSPEQCQSCFNRWHCAKGCPEICLLRSSGQEQFDCRMAKWIGLANIFEAAGLEITDHQMQYCEEFFESINIRERTAE
ncbi:hypothetical protein GF337_19105 [candidate division KSB1 bacterium]|nr:hypothetical protein [candidate division KSB1 bacterium]